MQFLTLCLPKTPTIPVKNKQPKEKKVREHKDF